MCTLTNVKVIPNEKEGETVKTFRNDWKLFVRIKFSGKNNFRLHYVLQAIVQSWHLSWEGKHTGGLLSVYRKTWLCSHNILDGVLLVSNFQHWQKKNILHHFLVPWSSVISKKQQLCLHVFSFTTFLKIKLLVKLFTDSYGHVSFIISIYN